MTDNAQPPHMVYAYAVLRPTPEAARAVAAVRGVADEQVGLVETGDLAAAVGPVPAEEFEEDALRAGLERLPRLAALARGHHGVVAALAPLGAVLPLRLATVYRDEDRVRQILQERRDQFLPLLERLAGHVEWGVKVYTDPGDPGDPGDPVAQADHSDSADQADSGARDGAAASEAAGERALGPGRAYLAARVRRRRGAEDAWQAAARAAARIAEEAGSLAVGRVAHRPQRGELAKAAAGGEKAGGEQPGGAHAGGAKARGENIANDAYLVPAARAEDFRSRVLAAADGQPGVRVEVTGPWAPYSFSLPPEAAVRPEPA
ncbi:Gas vesicle synthesis protein GvpL/GvpF [Streptomyces malaysiensis subsp. malaysiensis]|uniref:GvpL/GvpF family gas vesicle protein n=3 Tax=Streptomyces malaysiensis TaxID=92644 RepID=UPI000CA20FAC|nr:GvpL/GvpF family gas vesicle protein [Streptomyces sp. M56]AUA10240.1 Gas vesicle synthesis protein GvpL/GvpF [Streptomyces sp. M56]